MQAYSPSHIMALHTQELSAAHTLTGEALPPHQLPIRRRCSYTALPEVTTAVLRVRLQEKLYSPDQLPALMAECDYVVMATPHTPATHKMVGREALEAMRPHAVFVNVGRGKCVDEPALIEGGRSPLLFLCQHDWVVD